jgi:hypothetical protein
MCAVLPTELVDKIASGNCVLFLGAGATRDADGPSGSELAKLLSDHFKKSDIPTDDLRQFADLLTVLPDIDREDVDGKIVDVLKRLTPSEGHLALPSFCWKAIFTTNYDRLIEIAYETYRILKNQSPLQDLKIIALSDKDTPHISNPTVVGLWKIHGCISSIGPRSPLVLTSEDYKNTTRKRAKMLRFLKSLSKEHAILFIGYNFTDGVIYNLLDDLERESPYHSRRRMYAVVVAPSESEKKFFESKRILCIDCTFSIAFKQLSEHIESEYRKQCLTNRLPTIASPSGNIINLPPKLRVSLDSQLEVLSPKTSSQADVRRFLSGLPPTIGDLKNRNDVERSQESDLTAKVSGLLDSEDYLRPIVVVVGPGGAGKNTLALRVAYNLCETGAAVACHLRPHELWRREELTEFASNINCPSIFVIDGIEVRACYKAARELRSDLSAARCRSLLLLSCQKAVWNILEKDYPQHNAIIYSLEDCLTEPEAISLVNKLAQSNLITKPARRELQEHVSHIISECEGHLVVALLSLVKNGQFKNIILSEYVNLSDHAKAAYRYVALLHQHGLSFPDYLLNQLTVDNWNVFTDQVIRLESELVVVQDMNYSLGRICFRTRHPQIARVIVDEIIPKHEDRINMYVSIVKSLGTAKEDREFLLTMLTSESLRNDVREDKHMENLFDSALELFPEDTALILHLGKFENYKGSLDRAHEILEWGRSLNPVDSYIIHQLGVNARRRASREKNPIVRDATYREAQRFFRLKQSLDPLSHYGYSAEAKMQVFRADRESNAETKMDLLSAAEDTIRRGLEVVRDDDKGVMEECRALLTQALGNRQAVVDEIGRIEKKSEIRYAFTYHLLATCLFDLGCEAEAFSAVERGLDRFPGDRRLVSLILELLGKRFYDPINRDKCRVWLKDDRLVEEVGVLASFLQAVLDYYDNQFERSRDGFFRLRQSLRRLAPTKIKIYLADTKGKPEERSAPCHRGSKGRIFAKDPQTGESLPIDNIAKWESLGQPSMVVYNVGFSLAGPRARVLRGTNA